MSAFVDPVVCALCEALLDRDRRPGHLAWHARINARLHTLTEQLAELAQRGGPTL